ncbi:allene oxide synthase chloroplastic [Phtheirospermum japonicum]|uniref:Allene oxide synthase chloroplastic n=1 Tax=Phtheirospermum japonicum TaxID=374723 RepID=A0A830D9N5_9LAMI|nr:allene oxide synthase chloroplastic [Phtheirospermum japonicum]
MSSQTSELPAREIPGGYGLPFFGPIRDRYNYYYSQGEVQFFKARIEKHQSTVFRCNMPPGPFIARDPRVVCLLDAVSFRTLFDNSKVEKKDVLDGTFMPSLSFTGGYRACAYLDPSEPNHAALKGFFLTLLAQKHHKFVPLFRQAISGLFSGLEDEVASKGSSSFNDLSDVMSFEFVFRLFCDKSPLETSIGPKGPKMVDLWLALQLAPLTTSGSRFIPSILDDLMLHTFLMPFFLVKSNYKRLYDAFSESAKLLLDEGEKLGFKRDEVCHNLVFLAGFNAYGGMKALFPTLIKWVATSGQDLHRRLANEIRAVVRENGGVNLGAIDQMALTKSVVYEVLRIEPPVPYQYGKAKHDFEIQNHESRFLIKKGEMLFGYQTIATHDPRIFERPDEFIADRFVGEGERLLEYVYWSNGPENESPTTGNKQCPGRDLIVILCRLILVDFFLKYDTFDVEIGKLPFGSSVTFKSLTKATN